MIKISHKKIGIGVIIVALIIIAYVLVGGFPLTAHTTINTFDVQPQSVHNGDTVTVSYKVSNSGDCYGDLYVRIFLDLDQDNVYSTEDILLHSDELIPAQVDEYIVGSFTFDVTLDIVINENVIPLTLESTQFDDEEGTPAYTTYRANYIVFLQTMVTCYQCQNGINAEQTFPDECPDGWYRAPQNCQDKITCYQCDGTVLKTGTFDGPDCPDGWYSTKPDCKETPGFGLLVFVVSLIITIIVVIRRNL